MKLIFVVVLSIVCVKAEPPLDFNYVYEHIYAYFQRLLNAPVVNQMIMEKIGKEMNVKFENHTVETSDGYVLTIQRISNNRNAKPVLLMHGLALTSESWIFSGQNRSLALMLLENGFDVWLGNLRGNKFANEHRNFTEQDPEFWDFSWHEMGNYDLPATIDYILKETNHSELSYIGYSMGATAFFVMATELPEYCNKINQMVAMGATVYTRHTRLIPIIVQGIFNNEFKLLEEYFGNKRFGEIQKAFRTLAQSECQYEYPYIKICKKTLFLTCGPNDGQYNHDLMRKFFGLGFETVPRRILEHYTQIHDHDIFRQYDYGTQENMIKYEQNEPPEYDLNKVSCPVFIYYADNDFISGIQDVEKLVKKLPNVKSILVEDHNFNHIDFITANDVANLVYDGIIKNLKNL